MIFSIGDKFKHNVDPLGSIEITLITDIQGKIDYTVNMTWTGLGGNPLNCVTVMGEEQIKREYELISGPSYTSLHIYIDEFNYLIDFPYDVYDIYDEILENEGKKIKKCTHPNKYINKISNRLAFWICPDCGADLGDA